MSNLLGMSTPKEKEGEKGVDGEGVDKETGRGGHQMNFAILILYSC